LQCRETFGPLDFEFEDVVKEFVLIGSFKRRSASEQFEHQYTDVPNVKRFVMTTLLDHLRSEIFRSSTISESSQVSIEEV